jgi:DNA-binding SARP family transcriptional activator
MTAFEVRLFGRFSIQRQDRAIGGQVPSKVQELFTYLLLHRQHPLSRESVAALLWRDALSSQPKKNLRQALWQLQTVVDAQSDQGAPQVLLVEADWVVVNPDSDFWLDVAIFEQAFDATAGIAGDDLDDRRANALTAATELYRGDLLEGCYQDWCLFERERLQNAYMTMLDKLMVRCLAAGAYDAGVAYGERVLRIDRAHERTHRRLMRMRYLDGDRTAALAQYERCVAALRDEIGVGPAHQTTALYEQIRADRLPGDVAPSPAQPLAPNAQAGTIQELEQLRALLLDLRRQADQGIEAVGAVMRRQT